MIRTPAEKPAAGNRPTLDAGSPFDPKNRQSEVFFAAVETTRMPMTDADPHRSDNPIIFVNQAFLAMVGYSWDVIVGHNCRFLQGAQTDPDTIAAIRTAIRDRTELATEILNYRKDGSYFWNALVISPVHDKAGGLPKTRCARRRRWRRWTSSPAASRMTSTAFCRWCSATRGCRCGGWSATRSTSPGRSAG